MGNGIRIERERFSPTKELIVVLNQPHAHEEGKEQTRLGGTHVYKCQSDALKGFANLKEVQVNDK